MTIKIVNEMISFGHKNEFNCIKIHFTLNSYGIIYSLVDQIFESLVYYVQYVYCV